MKLTIRRKLGDERDVSLIREAVPFILARLLKPEQVRRVSLHITITKLADDFGDIALESAPAFRLRLHHEMDTLAMLVTLAHELVHLAQIMDRRLELRKIKGLATWYWKREAYGADPYNPSESRDLPWEVEANDLEGDLACQFFAFYVRKLNGG